MSGEQRFCINCGAEITGQTASRVCPACGKDPDPEEHLFREFLLEHTKSKLKSDIDSKLFDIIKNWLLSHLYGIVLSIAVIAAAAVTINTAGIMRGVRRADKVPMSIAQTESESPADPEENTVPEQAGWWPFGSKRWKTITRTSENGSPVSFTYDYDEKRRLTGIRSTFMGRTMVTECETGSDGRWLRQSDDEIVRTYVYDENDRLISMVEKEYSEHDGEGMVYDGTFTYTYNYDDSGKIISAEFTGTGTTYVKDAVNNVDERTGTEKYIYDENDVLIRVESHYDARVTAPGDGSEDAFEYSRNAVDEYGY